MYKSSKVCLIYQDDISQTFPTKIGLKQGNVFNTILFNIYKNDSPRRLLQDSTFSDIISVCKWLNSFFTTKTE